MRKDPTEFRQRFAAWKNGEQPYKDGLPVYRDGKGGGRINYSRWDNAELTSYPVPFIDEKRITLTNAGRATGAVLSTNLLDSIADNADRAGFPLQTALGLAVKETTLGNPTDDRSAWNLSSGIRREFNNKYPGTEQHINYWGDALNEREDVINYHKGHQSDDPNSKRKSVLQEAFEFYMQHPDKYNPGQPNYQTAVDKRGVEAMQSPEVQKWLKQRNIKKATGRFNRLNPLLNESKLNPTKYKDGKPPGYYTGTPWGDTEEQEAVKEWGEDWKTRTTAAGSSKVLHRWNVSGSRPKPESSQHYTKRRVAEETKRTWLSDAADIAKGVKEGALSMSPYTALPYFGAKVGQDILNDNVGAETAIDAAFAAAPFMPKFELPSTIKPVVNRGEKALNDIVTNKGFAISSPRIGKISGKDAGQFTVWIPFDRSWSKGLSWINTGSPTAEGLPVQYITSKYPGEGRKLYDAVINKAIKEGHPGIISGRELISAPKTYRTLEHYYPNRVKIDNMGHWSNDGMTGLFTGPSKHVYTIEDFLKATSENPTERVHFIGAPRYRLETPSKLK